MLAQTANITALILYACATGYLLTLLLQRKPLARRALVIITGVAVIAHATGLYPSMMTPQGIDLAINKVFSLVMLTINVIVVLSSQRKPLHNLFIVLLPLSILAVAVSSISFADATDLSHFGAGVSAHILLSIIAYSLLTIATLQALLLHWQNNRLKNRQLSGFVKHLPPLQTMESLMFELLWVGVISLAAGIIVGALFLDDIFAQHLLHKTTLSIIAWLIFSALLWGRATQGWRGNIAIRWVLGGFCVLMLAYFGSKIVIDIIIK